MVTSCLPLYVGSGHQLEGRDKTIQPYTRTTTVHVYIQQRKALVQQLQCVCDRLHIHTQQVGCHIHHPSRISNLRWMVLQYSVLYLFYYMYSTAVYSRVQQQAILKDFKFYIIFFFILLQSRRSIQTYRHSCFSETAVSMVRNNDAGNCIPTPTADESHGTLHRTIADVLPRKRAIGGCHCMNGILKMNRGSSFLYPPSS